MCPSILTTFPPLSKTRLFRIGRVERALELCPPEVVGMSASREPPFWPISGGGISCRKTSDPLPCRMCRPGVGKGIDVHACCASLSSPGVVFWMLSLRAPFSRSCLADQAVPHRSKVGFSRRQLFYLSALACYVWAGYRSRPGNDGF